MFDSDSKEITFKKNPNVGAGNTCGTALPDLAIDVGKVEVPKNPVQIRRKFDEEKAAAAVLENRKKLADLFQREQEDEKKRQLEAQAAMDKFNAEQDAYLEHVYEMRKKMPCWNYEVPENNIEGIPDLQKLAAIKILNKYCTWDARIVENQPSVVEIESEKTFKIVLEKQAKGEIDCSLEIDAVAKQLDDAQKALLYANATEKNVLHAWKFELEVGLDTTTGTVSTKIVGKELIPKVLSSSEMPTSDEQKNDKPQDHWFDSEVDFSKVDVNLVYQRICDAEDQTVLKTFLWKLSGMPNVDSELQNFCPELTKSLAKFEAAEKNRREFLAKRFALEDAFEVKRQMKAKEDMETFEKEQRINRQIELERRKMCSRWQYEGEDGELHGPSDFGPED